MCGPPYMLFNAGKFDYLSFACKNNSLSSNVYVNPDLNIINQHDNIKDLGILMSSDCSFEKHILSRGDQPFFSIVLIVLYNSSLERSHPKASKTGFIFVVGPILKILHHF